jgi:hypothetical protein
MRLKSPADRSALGGKLEEYLPAFAAASCDIDAREGLPARVHAHAQAVASLELAAMNILVISCDLGHIEEGCEADYSGKFIWPSNR